MHSHSLHAVMATMLDPQASEFKVTHLEMIKVGGAQRRSWQAVGGQQGVAGWGRASLLASSGRAAGVAAANMYSTNSTRS